MLDTVSAFLSDKWEFERHSLVTLWGTSGVYVAAWVLAAHAADSPMVGTAGTTLFAVATSVAGASLLAVGSIGAVRKLAGAIARWRGTQHARMQEQEKEAGSDAAA